MGFVAFLAKLLVKLVDFGRNGFQTLAVFLHLLQHAFFHTDVTTEALIPLYAGDDEF